MDAVWNSLLCTSFPCASYGDFQSDKFTVPVLQKEKSISDLVVTAYEEKLWQHIQGHTGTNSTTTKGEGKMKTAESQMKERGSGLKTTSNVISKQKESL